MRARGRLLLVLVACGCDGDPASPRRSDLAINEVELTAEGVRAAHIALATVEDHEFDATIPATGYIAFDDSLLAHVVSPVAGRVTQIDVTVGDRVDVGQTLAIITSPDIGQASSELAKARAELAAAAQNNRRQHELFAKHATTQHDVDTAEAAYRQANAELVRARERVALLGGDERVAQGYRLRAPIAGHVTARNAVPGMEVTGQYAVGGSSELFTIGRIDRVWVLVDVYEVDLPRVHVGDAVEVTTNAYPGRGFPGHVDWIPISFDPEQRTARVRCAHANPDSALRPEMYVAVTIHVGKRRALAIPRNAVFRLGERTFAFVVRDDTPPGIVRFARLPVDTDEGQPTGWVEVTRGLARGQRVAVAGVEVLRSMLDNREAR